MMRTRCGGMIRSGLTASSRTTSPELFDDWKQTCVEIVADEIQQLAGSNGAFELIRPVDAVEFFDFIDLPSGEIVMAWRVACSRKRGA